MTGILKATSTDAFCCCVYLKVSYKKSISKTLTFYSYNLRNPESRHISCKKTASFDLKSTET